MCSTAVTVITTIATTIIGGMVGYFSARRISNLNTRQLAAAKFRAGIIYELTGFYPVDHYWEEKDFPRLYQNMPRIKSMCAEFRYFVKSKDAFDTAVKNYDEYCRKTTYGEISAYSMYPTMRKDGEIDPREKFNNIVKHLLSFAERK
ncbi:MAG: hypothetical protein A4E62_02779 [Syntrophorhabdus sp. PtaU1.Bin002]|nr:MAG: hypothetical protein A4E62_02779 [Syntrophorhabdus sp. PtaU1.Bin002]